jgi:protein phosphatase
MTLPPRLRVVGDVHGDSRAFAAAAATDRFVVQLGDLVDDGPDTPGVLAIMFRLIDEGRGIFLLGNHDYKLARLLTGAAVKSPESLRTRDELAEDMRARFVAQAAQAPAWACAHDLFFVHGGFDTRMLHEPPAHFATGRPGPLLSRALYGQPSGRVTGAGKPERLLAWVDDIPAHMTVYCGHDRRSTDGRPYVRTNARGGKAVFMDTGAGKGGHLSWVDVDTADRA